MNTLSQMISGYFLSAGKLSDLSIAGHYNLVMVVFSVLVAMLASYAAFFVSERNRKTDSEFYRMIWLVAGGICLGGGIWTTHFIAMLAFNLPVTVGYDPILTIVSVLPAIIASIVVLSPRDNIKKSSTRFLLDSLLMALGIGMMHYIGMAAMRIGVEIRLDPTIFILSVLTAIVGSALSLQLKTWFETSVYLDTYHTRSMVGAAIFMGLAISGMHYIAMEGTHFIQAQTAPSIGMELRHDFLSNVIGFISGGILLLLISAVHMGRRQELISLLEASETRQQTILDSVAEAIVTIDGQGLVRSFNRGAEKIFQYPANDVIGKDVTMLLPEHERDKYQKYIRESRLRSTRVINKARDMRGRKKYGALFPIELNVTPMMIRKNKFFVGVIRDISEQKIYENSLLKAKEEAETASRAKSDFLASMSHELRTPMNAILGFAQFLKYDPKNVLNDEQLARVNHIIKGGDHLLDLIKQVLELNTIEAGRISLTIDHISPRAVIDDCLPMIRIKAGENDIEIIDQTLGKDLPLLWTDEMRLKQTILNILTNAIKYNRDGGEVIIACNQRTDGMFRLSIADTGYGIPPELQKNLFEPFDRLGREAGQIEGSGIGLSITRKIIEVLGGRIGFSSETGQGSTFWIDIPMSEKSSADKTNVQEARISFASLDKSSNKNSSRTVLYIEDNPDNIKIMETVIGRLERTKLMTAHKAELGLSLARQHRPDLIIIDIDLPGASGIDVLNKYRTTAETAETPVVAVTSVSDTVQVNQGVKAGFRCYLIKPLDIEEAVEVITGILKQTAESIPQE